MTALDALLGSRTRRAVFAGSWRVEDGDPTELVDAHLRGDLVLGAKHGGDIEPETLMLGWDVDAHNPKQCDVRGATLALLDAVAAVRFHPPLVTSSKSARGFHVRVLLDAPVPSPLARRVALAILEAAGDRPEYDRGKVYPGGSGDGLVLALPLHGLEGTPRFSAPGGSRIVHLQTLVPYPDDLQIDTLDTWPRSTAAMVERAPKADDRPVAPVIHLPVDRSHEPLPPVGSDLDILMSECEFMLEAQSRPAGLEYDDWFALASILKAFPGGAAVFDAISRRDSKRYRTGEPDKKMRSVRGAPRHCANLSFRCPRLVECSAIRVSSPAGYPYRLRAVLREIEQRSKTCRR